MNDDDLERRLGTALRERFPRPTDVDLLSRLDPRAAARWARLRVVIAVAACVSVVAALSIVLALHTSETSHQPSAAGPLIGVTWQGSEPILTVVFTEHTVRVFDGCTNELREVTIGAGVLDIGQLIAPGGVCTGTPGGPPPEVANFDAVMASHHLTWQRNSDTLQLINDQGQGVELHAAGTALSMTGQQWALERYVDARGYGHEGNYSGARLLVGEDGTVHASDMCNDLTGSATVSDTTITFTDMHSTDQACTDDASTAVAGVVDRVLSGDVTYAIRGDELIINGQGQGLLIYGPSR